METEKHYFKVGAFFLAVLALFVGSMIVFGKNGGTASTARYAIYFDNSIGGLIRGAPVKMKGITVGTVYDISFAGKGSDRILITADIDENAPLRADTVASIAFQGITGATFLSIENSKPAESAAPLVKKDGERYPVIPSAKSEFQAALSNAPEVMGGLAKTTVQMQKLLSDDNIATVQALLDETHHTLAEATGALREFKMLARTLRDDPSLILRGSKHEGYKVQK